MAECQCGEANVASVVWETLAVTGEIDRGCEAMSFST